MCRICATALAFLKCGGVALLFVAGVRVMVALGIRPGGGLSLPFWLSAVWAALTPAPIGHQDLAAFIARQPGVSERWRDHLIASPFGTIHAATFSFSRPIGTAMPEPEGVQPVNFDPRSLDGNTWSLDRPLAERPPGQRVEYPTVNRRLKGDRLRVSQPVPPSSAPASTEPAGLPPLQPVNAPASQPTGPTSPNVMRRPKSAENGAGQILPADADPDAPVEAFGTLPVLDQTGDIAAASGDWATAAAGTGDTDADDAGDDRDDGTAALPPEITAGNSSPAGRPSTAALSYFDEKPAERTTQLYFGVAAMGAEGGLERWEAGAEPVPVPSAADSAIRLSALRGSAEGTAGGEPATGKTGVSRFMSPANRLGLSGKSRAKAEKCMADAVYFEARGEPRRGQEAVAQVVMNRVFSGKYPNDVCGVVYQNAHRHLACQFTFACEGKDLSRIDEPDMWEQAKRIAKDTLDGKIWLSEVGHATHYHAYWVRPSWVHEMAKLYKLGVHTFYRPRAWGDGSDAPNWGITPVSEKSPTAPGPAASPKVPQASLETGAKTRQVARL